MIKRDTQDYLALYISTIFMEITKKKQKVGVKHFYGNK